MKILHVSPSFYPTRAYGGTIRSSYGLCRGLAELGCDVRVLTTDTDGIGRNLDVPNDRDVVVDGMQVRYCHKLLRNSVSLDLLRVIREYIEWADAVHSDRGLLVSHVPDAFLLPQIQEATGLVSQRFTAAMGRIDAPRRQVSMGGGVPKFGPEGQICAACNLGG